jgi:hypothetical protein
MRTPSYEYELHQALLRQLLDQTSLPTQQSACCFVHDTVNYELTACADRREHLTRVRRSRRLPPTQDGNLRAHRRPGLRHKMVITKPAHVSVFYEHTQEDPWGPPR